MDDDRYTPARPSADAFREPVRGEDPSRWGRRDESTRRMGDSDMTTRRMGDKEVATRNMAARDIDTSSTRVTSTDPRDPNYRSTITSPTTTTPATGPVVTDPTPATYTGTTVGERRVIEERGRIAHAEPPVENRRFSLGATFLGWAVAAFFTLVFSAFAVAAVGGTLFSEDGLLDFSDANGLVIGTLVGYLIATFLAYLIGGYAAGRIALWDGVKHGLGTVGWAILFALVAVIAGSAIADAVDMQNLNTYLGAFNFENLTGGTILAIVLTLAAMLGGAALGGMFGERYHDRVHGVDWRTRRAGRMRGRPL